MKKYIILLLLLPVLAGAYTSLIVNNSNVGIKTISNSNTGIMTIENPVYPETLPATLPFNL